MATSTNAFFLLRGSGSRVGGTGLIQVADGPFAPEVEPTILWGQGTPAGTLAPWTLVNKGSLYAEVNDTDDQSHVWMKVDEGNDANDWMPVLIGGNTGTTGANTIAQTYVDAELHGVDVAYTGTQASGGNLVALNVAHTTAGTAGTWSGAVYAKITQGTTKNVTGYLTAAEFEVVNSCATSGMWWVLTLNANNKAAAQAGSGYIVLRDYGSTPTNVFLSLYDQTSFDTTSAKTSLLFTKASPTIAEINVAIRCTYDTAGTPFWLLGTRTAPN